MTREVRERQKLDGDGGVVLEKVFPGTSAAEAGFRAGDVIVAVGGTKVTGIPAFLGEVAEARAGDGAHPRRGPGRREGGEAGDAQGDAPREG